MKQFLLMFTLLFVAACDGGTEVKPAPVNTKFLTLKQIEAKLDQYQEKNVEEFMTDNIREKIKNLPKSEDLLKGVKDLVPNDKQVMSDTYTASSVDYRQYDQAIVSQWNGTCTSHATVAMMETLSNLKYRMPVKLSERDLWSKPEVYKMYSAEAAMKGASTHFIVKDKYWPHENEKPAYNNHTKYGFAKIAKSYYLGSEYNRVLFRMSQSETAKIAMSVPYSMTNCDAVINPNSAPIENAGHDIAISGVLVSEKYGPIAIIKNSWGADCGDHGYQYLPLNLCEKNDHYCYFWTASELSFNQ
jgi:C1A family cysteine protease